MNILKNVFKSVISNFLPTDTHEIFATRLKGTAEDQQLQHFIFTTYIMFLHYSDIIPFTSPIFAFSAPNPSQCLACGGHSISLNGLIE